MSIRLLEHIRDELRGAGAIQNTPEFCTSWLGRSEMFLGTWACHRVRRKAEVSML